MALKLQEVAHFGIFIHVMRTIHFIHVCETIKIRTCLLFKIGSILYMYQIYPQAAQALR